jgi:hypothetical protein
MLVFARRIVRQSKRGRNYACDHCTPPQPSASVRHGK